VRGRFSPTTNLENRIRDGSQLLSAEAERMTDSPWVAEVTGATFQQEVVDRSRSVPVVLDFWAPWCGPCRSLGPMLERLAAELAGLFVLAKVNTDESPELAQAFRVEGIPAVFAVRNGELVDRFEGLLPEAELRKFLDRLTGTPTPNPLDVARELEGRDPAAAVRAYRALFSEQPDDPEARVGLARALLASSGNEAEAAALLARVDSGDQLTEADRLRTVLKLREVPHADADLAVAKSAAASEDAAALLRLGRLLAARGEYLPALDSLLAAAEADRTLGRGPIREVMVDVFTVIGPRSPEADDYRTRLRSLLY
jgi:putative thioredoxin